MKKIKLYTAVLLGLLIGLSTSSQAQQGFKGGLILGTNFSQIDGDMLAGYDKVGLSAGLRLSYPIKPQMDLSLEMLYSVRGSQEKLFGDGNSGVGKTSLRYLELPFVFSYKDWHMADENYHKVKVDAGLSAGYLFDVDSDNLIYRDDIGNLREYDVSWLAGISYNFTRHIGTTVRYNRSLVDLYKGDILLVSYFVTLRLDYNF